MKQIKLERNETKGNVGGHFETFCSEQDLYVGRTQKNLKHFCLRNNTPFGLVEISSGVIYINNSLVLKLSVVSSVHGLRNDLKAVHMKYKLGSLPVFFRGKCFFLYNFYSRLIYASSRLTPKLLWPVSFGFFLSTVSVQRYFLLQRLFISYIFAFQCSVFS